MERDGRLVIALEVLEDHDMLEEANILRARAKMKGDYLLAKIMEGPRHETHL